MTKATHILVLFAVLLFIHSMPALAQGETEALADFVFETVAEPEDPAVLHLRRGELALREGMYDNAISNFQAYLTYVGERQPELSQALGKLAEAYLLKKDYPQAESLLRQEQAKRASLPDHSYAWLLYLQAELYFQQKLWQDCLSLLQSGSRLDYGKYAQAVLLLQVDCLAQLGEWQQIIKLMEPYLQEKNQEGLDFALYSRLLKAYLAGDEPQKALLRLAQIKEKISPEDEFDFKILQVSALALAKEPVQALAYYAEISSRCPLEENPDWWRMLWHLGESAYGHDLFEEAEAAYKQAFMVAGNAQDRGKCLRRIADCQIKQKKDAEARLTLEEFRRKFPEQPEYVAVSMRLAELLQESDNTLKAAELYAELANNAKMVPIELRYEAAKRQAKCLVHDGQLLPAVEAYRQAAALSAYSAELASESLFRAAETAILAKSLQQAASLYEEAARRYAQSELGKRARFEQARTLFEMSRYKEAEEVYMLFVSEQPEHELRWEAQLQALIARKTAAADPEALNACAHDLLSYARQSPKPELAWQAYVESYQSMKQAGKTQELLPVLQEALQKQPEAKDAALLEYELVALNFQLGNTAEALSLADGFFARHGREALAAPLYLMLGDYFVAESQFDKAQSYYREINSAEHEGRLKALAVYENARCAFLLEHYEQAESLLKLLLAEEAGSLESEAELRGKAQFLLGDIYALRADYELARASFALARNSAKDSELGYAALGRQAEMLMELAVDDETLWDKAFECLQEILQPGSSASEELREMAHYRMARCWQEKGQLQEAILAYQEIYLNFVSDRDAGKVRPWRYYYLSVFALTQLLERQGDLDSLRKAARYYEDLAASKLPRSQEAAMKAKAIRERHQLGKKAAAPQ